MSGGAHRATFGLTTSAALYPTLHIIVKAGGSSRTTASSMRPIEIKIEMAEAVNSLLMMLFLLLNPW